MISVVVSILHNVPFLFDVGNWVTAVFQLYSVIAHKIRFHNIQDFNFAIISVGRHTHTVPLCLISIDLRQISYIVFKNDSTKVSVLSSTENFISSWGRYSAAKKWPCASCFYKAKRHTPVYPN